jgi:hypothetical protein
MTGSTRPVHIHAHGSGLDHVHAHDPAVPHPSQPAPWSILRMSVGARLAAAFGVSAALWTIVWIAMRPI